jgi:adenosylmethionine-8-amino-7-oxononanoate transaminase
MDMMERDRGVLWHPYTQMKDFENEPMLFVDRAEGVFLFDNNGGRFYDTISSWWCILHGHNHPRIKAAITAQMDRLEQVHLAGTTHEGAILLAERLVEMTPANLTKVFYSDNGSTACEVALKMSFQFWKQTGATKREKFVSLERGYHGDTIGTMSVGGVPGFRGAFSPLLFESFRLPSPYCYRCPCGEDGSCSCRLACLDPLEKLLENRGYEIAGIILEPLLQAAGGMIVYPEAYLRRMAEITKRHGIHLILDEVATGFGRTGRMFALEHAGVEPDFVCLSKGLTAGYLPMAATLTTEEVYQAFYDDYAKGKTFFHGHTYTGNPLAAAAGLASLNTFEEDGVLEEVQDRSSRLQKEKARFSELPWVGDVRGIGMVAAFELVQDRVTKAPFPAELRMGREVYRLGLKHGVILRPLGDVVYLFLPLCVTDEQLGDILERTYAAVSRLEVP